MQIFSGPVKPMTYRAPFSSSLAASRLLKISNVCCGKFQQPPLAAANDSSADKCLLLLGAQQPNVCCQNFQQPTVSAAAKTLNWALHVLAFSNKQDSVETLAKSSYLRKCFVFSIFLSTSSKLIMCTWCRWNSSLGDVLESSL